MSRSRSRSRNRDDDGIYNFIIFYIFYFIK